MRKWEIDFFACQAGFQHLLGSLLRMKTQDIDRYVRVNSQLLKNRFVLIRFAQERLGEITSTHSTGAPWSSLHETPCPEHQTTC
jgi:hypothetical protein